MADLTNPSERYQDSYLAALQEFQAEGRHLELLLEEYERLYYRNT